VASSRIPLLSVLHEDEDLLVVDKPPGLVCHPTRHGELSSLIGRVRVYLGHADGRLVNRLDRETSGIVLLAKRKAVASELGRLFTGDLVVKRYLAIVHGELPVAPFAIVAPLGKDESSPVAIKDAVRPDGAHAETQVRRLRVFSRTEGTFSLAEIAPRTGRKHQIRIHLAHAGYPIVGDKLYGADEQRYLRLVTDTLTGDDWRALVLRHHALHAARLSFAWRDRSWAWEAAAPEAFTTFASGLPGGGDAG
jgi:23S rRNA pseudouridine1911/1915/1917 synthase